jgi:CDP-glucose 4,6-dehydratase
MVTSSGTFRGYAGRRVLVTGHTGFKGSWLSLWLKRLGATVTGFSDGITTDPSHFEAISVDLDDRRGDICDPLAIAKVVADSGPEIIFHLAAQSLVRRAYLDPIATYQTNLIGTLAVLEAASRNGVGAVVVATTDKVYLNDESGRAYGEQDELGGLDPYSASKSCAEIAVRSYRETIAAPDSMMIATVRAGNVIGGGDWSQDRLVPDLMRAAFGGQTASIRNPDSTRPWQHVLDVLAGYLILGERLLAGDRAAGDAWNIGPLAANIRVGDLVTAIRDQIPGLDVEITPDHSGRPESGLLQLDSTKARDRLGWRPVWEDDMIGRTIDWYRAYYEQGRAISGEQLDQYEAALGR